MRRKNLISNWKTFATAMLIASVAGTALGQVRLVGITGNQEFNPAEDETLFEVSLSNATTTRLLTLTHVPDTDSIGYNPISGLVFHFNGNESYSNNPASNGYRDNQYIETVNLATNAIVPVINSNPPPSPDTAQSFGLPAPRPSWVLPADLRLDSQNTDEFRQRGENEYHGIRDAAWSRSERVFYGADEQGIFKVTPNGNSVKIGQPLAEPQESKGISFVNIAGNNRLFISSKSSPALYELNPLTGEEIGTPVDVMVPTTVGGNIYFPANKVVGLTTHPVSGELYGIAETGASDPLNDRQLVKINPLTGIAELIGNLRTPNNDAAFSSIKFVGFRDLACDFDLNGLCNIVDIDALVTDVVAGADGTLYDMNGDGSVNLADVDAWRVSAGDQNIGVGRPYLVGDANLDGVVDGTDFGIWNSNKFTNTGKWSQGDFNADGVSDGSDFGLWNSNKFTASDGSVVPEPSVAAIAMLLVSGLSLLRRR